MISVVVVSYNEADTLKKCLSSIKDFADEIVVIDLESSDNTQQIAKDFKAKIFTHSKVDYVEKVRNFAISKATGSWILILDPDELIGEELKRKLKEAAEERKYEAINIPRKNIFFGKWISHSNWWPDRHIRFFEKESTKWEEKIHSYPVVLGKILNLEAKENLAISHFGYISITEFLDRQNRYSEIESFNLYSSGVRFSWKDFCWRPLREFLARFIKHQGYLDGFTGFSLIFLMMVYQLEVAVKLWEKGNSKK